MVTHPGTAAGTGGLRFLNDPVPAAVEADPQGRPKAMLWRGTYRRIVAVHDTWRIDDEWWRGEISRRYFEVEVEGGRRATVYRDLVTDCWYLQPYSGPRAN